MSPSIAIWTIARSSLRPRTGEFHSKRPSSRDTNVVVGRLPNARCCRFGAIGRELGGVALGETQAQVAATLGEPTRKTISHGLGSPRWEYASGYAVAFSGVQPTVWQVEGRPPVLARTREGFGLGDPTSKFRTLYGSQQPQEFSVEGLTQLQVSTPTEVLIVGFSRDDRADFVILRTEPGPP